MRKHIGAVMLAILGLIGSGIFPSYASAAPHTTSKTPTVSVTITSVGNPTIREGEKLRVQARVTNKGDSPLNLAAELRATDTFSTRSHLLTFMGSDKVTIESAAEPVLIATAPEVLAIDAHSHTTVTLEADTARLGWTAQNWGPRGIEVAVTSDQGDNASERSFVIVEPSAGVQPVPTGIVIPLTDSRAELADLYTVDNLTDVRTQPTERIKNLAETMTMKGVSVIADPAYADLSRAPQTIMSAKADADIIGLLDNGYDDEAQTLTAGTFKYDRAPVRVKSLGSFEAFADYEELGASAFILDSSWFSSSRKSYASPATHTLLKNDGSTFDVLLNDNESAQEILSAPNALQMRQKTLALSAMTYLEQPSIVRPQLLYFDLSDKEIWKVNADEKVVRDYSQLAEASSALMNAPWVQPAQVSDLLASPASTSVQLPLESTVDTDAHDSPLTKKNLASIDASVQEAATLASLVDTPDTVLAPVDNASAYLYSQNWQGNDKAYASALKNFSALAKKYGNSVSPVSVSTINLVAEQADIPVRLQNKLNVPATVSVALDSVDARLTAKKPVTVELPPASTTTVAIPVSARGSGNVQAEIRLYNSQGQDIGTPVTVKVRVRAGWENTATAVMAVLVGLMLVIGIIRSIKGGRRSKPVAPSEYTKARRKADADFTAHRTQGMSLHDSP